MRVCMYVILCVGMHGDVRKHAWMHVHAFVRVRIHVYISTH